MTIQRRSSARPAAKPRRGKKPDPIATTRPAPARTTGAPRRSPARGAQNSAAPWRATLAKSIDDYLALLPPAERAVLSALRKVIHKAAPQASELISYRVPTFKQDGMLVAFSASPTHCALHVMSPPLMKALEAQLEGYDVSAATIRFTTAAPLPAELVTTLVQARLAENQRRVARADIAGS
jgi:uncharacterized protein YdhG (YjbR/CyaY superfamily)